MRELALGGVLAVGVCGSGAIAADQPSMECKTGPITKTFGGGQWLIYDCDVDGYLTLVTAPGNPAYPDVLVLHRETDGWRIASVGTGDRRADARAVQDILALSDQDILSLIAEAKHSDANPGK